MSTTSQKTPEALSAASRASQLTAEGKLPAPRQSIQERRASLALSGNSTKNAAGQVRPDEDFEGSSLSLNPREVVAYDNNPRQRRNPAYSSLKTSIRARGYEGALVVTRRPDDNRYMLAAGGNTSLAIIQELLEEEPDNPRWQSINLIYKKWPGEAAILAAHLAENDARGDTPFWDKACGVAKMKAELQAALGRPLSAQEVSKEAARMGAEYGVRAVQCFLFAVDNLAPIGPWLTFNAVQDAFSPAFNSLLGLAETFAVSSTEFRAKVNDTFELCATVLRTQEANDSEGKVELDVQDVLLALNEATAQLIGVDTQQLMQMLSVRASHPRMPASQLRQLTGAPSSLSAGGARIEPPTGSAPVSKKAAATREPASGQDQLGTAPVTGQIPLGPMLAPVASSTTAASRGPETQGSASDFRLSQNALGTVREVLSDITRAADLGDLVWACDEMPLGFFVELPESGIETTEDGVTVAKPDLRKAAWHVLASLSGQYDRRFLADLPDDSRWKRLLTDGGFQGQFELQVQGVVHAGSCNLPVEDLHRFLWNPQLGPLFLQLWACAMHWMDADPARFPQIQPVAVSA